MAFLDNSGDIILDAVLTDTGRMRLAKADGSFRIVKFALGDDEIDYSLYNKNHPSGSAYYDLEILQTPILEAFTNNASSMKSVLLTISRDNLLYLPVIKVNNLESQYTISELATNGYILAVDQDTEELLLNTAINYNGTPINQKGILNGFSITTGQKIILDQGIDNANVPSTRDLSADLVESQYLVEIDNRFAQIYNEAGTSAANPSFIDDDNIATYSFSMGSDVDYVQMIPKPNSNTNPNNINQVIAGSRGTRIKFKIAASLEAQTSNYLFDTLGTEITNNFSGVTGISTVKSILTNIRIIGATTGFSVEIPILLIKQQ